MGLLDGKVALISGAGKGQGRSHAVRFAQEGADIIGFDICAQVTSQVTYPMAEPGALDRTCELVEAAGGKMISGIADVRDFAQVKDIVDQGLTRFGHIDIVCPQAGINSYHWSWEIPPEAWDAIIAVNLTGAWNTVRAAIPSMIEARRGGTIVFTSSTGGIRGLPLMAHYCASKFGVIGLMKVMANELGRFDIRVNAVHPCGVAGEGEFVSGMGMQDDIPWGLFDRFPSMAPGPGVLRDTAADDEWATMRKIDPVDISNAILYLASEAGRYVTGVQLPVDLGSVNHA
jgi:(+)-trans-carveol dehydrogenase